jgi:Cupin domain
MAVIKTNPEETQTIEGVEHGSTISLILDRSNPGQGPRLHRHPYDETWLVVDGTVNFQAGNETRAARPGDVVIAPANTPHQRRSRSLKARVHPRQPHGDRRMAGIAVVRPRTAYPGSLRSGPWFCPAASICHEAQMALLRAARRALDISAGAATSLVGARGARSEVVAAGASPVSVQRRCTVRGLGGTRRCPARLARGRLAGGSARPRVITA